MYHNYTDVRITRGFVLRINLRFEQERLAGAMKILHSFGSVFPLAPWVSRYKPIGSLGECFLNACRFASDIRGYYCEGFILVKRGSMEYPMAHAWVLSQDLELLDPTSPSLQGLDEVSYLGIPFKTDYVLHKAAQNGYYGLLDGHPEYGRVNDVYLDPPCWWFAGRFPTLFPIS